jgi:ferric-dicitrate binding protein FerR (iron transport regulator)
MGMTEKLDRIIKAHLEGKASAIEKEKLEQWLAASEENRRAFRLLERVWSEPLPHPKYAHAEDIKDQAWERTHTSRIIPATTNRRLHWYYVAASVLFILTFSGFLYLNYTPPAGALEEQITYVQKSNPRGVKSTIHLPDGSQVVLNSESSIRYRDGFSGDIRSIELTGEAYFEVVKNTSRPFEVMAGGYTARVLGTSFNVRAFPGEQTVQVALVEGEVSVSDGVLPESEVVMLGPGEFVKIGPDRKKSTGTFDPLLVTAWKDGTLVFRDAGFNTVISTLERWYAVTFEYDRVATDWHFDGQFSNAYLEDVLYAISHSEDIQYEIHGDKIKLIAL